MKTLKKPPFTVMELLQDCIENSTKIPYKMRVSELKDNLSPSLSELEETYTKLASEYELHTFNDPHNINVVAKKQLLDLYTNQLANKKHALRTLYYDKIMSLAEDDRCPFCEVGKPTTLDHYLPKKEYPSLAVTPVNLIPSCKDCNSVKHFFVAVNQQEQLLHPYFDDTNKGRWLFATFEEKLPLSITFKAVPSRVFDSTLSSRICNQFTRLDLNKVYSVEITECLLTIKTTIKNVGLADKKTIQTWLQGCAEDFLRTNQNHWRSAIYDALSKSEWACGILYDEIFVPLSQVLGTGTVGQK